MRTLLKRAIGATSVCALAVGMVLGANAFTKKDQVKAIDEVLTDPTWYFTGGASDNPELASNYSLLQDPNKPCDSSSPEVICQIQAPNSGGQPDMNATSGTSTVKLQIRAAHQSIQNGTPTTNLTVKEFRPE